MCVCVCVWASMRGSRRSAHDSAVSFSSWPLLKMRKLVRLRYQNPQLATFLFRLKKLTELEKKMVKILQSVVKML